MTLDAPNQRSRAAVERVRAAIAAAGEPRLALLAHVKRFRVALLRARAAGCTMREIAAESGVSAQCLQYRERMALRALARP